MVKNKKYESSTERASREAAGEEATASGIGGSEESLTSQLEEKASQSSEGMKETLFHVKDKVSGYLHETREKAQDIEERMEGQLREHPLISLLIVAGLSTGISLALSGLLRKRSGSMVPKGPY